MARSPKQPSVEGERLRREVAEARRLASTFELTYGTIFLFANDVDPGSGWHRCNGQSLLRERYPRLTKVLSTTGDNATIAVPTLVPPAGTFYWIWGPD
jgi:hypothetical protein